MSNDSLKVLVFIASIAGAMTIGYQHHARSSQDANDLIEAGFTITDPDGFEVERFDGGDISYWTTESIR